MPTLDDTIEFQASTLNDLLEAEAQTGIAVGGADDRTRKWAILATAAAAIFAVLFVGALLTGGGGGGGGSAGGGKALQPPPGTVSKAVTVNVNLLSGDVRKKGALVNVVSDDSTVLARGAMVLNFQDVKGTAGRNYVKFDLAVKPDERQAIQAQQTGHALNVESGGEAPAPASTAPAQQTPSTEPAPAPAPAPAGQ